MDHWLGAAHTPKPASLSTGEALPATIRGSTSRYGTSVQAPALDVAGSLPQPVGYEQETPCPDGSGRARRCGRQSVEQEHDRQAGAGARTHQSRALQCASSSLDPMLVRCQAHEVVWM